MINYLSKEKLEELKKKLKELQTVKRFEIADKLEKAKSFGDLSENFEYISAKEEQAALEQEISELELIINNSEVINKSKNVNFVSVGHKVLLENKKNKKKISYTIVGSQEADPDKNKISNSSPIGKAIIGKKIGETAIVKTPKGINEFKILSIE